MGLLAALNIKFSTLYVQFTDQSLGDTPANSWLWGFEDMTGSSAQNPVHDYTIPGIYDVSLTVNNGVDPQSSITKVAYIVVYGSSGMIVKIAGKGSSSNSGELFFSEKKESPITLINQGYVCFEPHVINKTPGAYKWDFRKIGTGDPFVNFSTDIARSLLLSSQ